MPSFQITTTPSRRAAVRFINAVRRKLQKAAVDEKAKNNLTQTEIARRIGVHRSVINRELRGRKDLTLGRVAELAWAMGLEASFDLVALAEDRTVNHTLERFEVGASAGQAVAPAQAGGPHLRQVSARVA